MRCSVELLDRKKAMLATTNTVSTVAFYIDSLHLYVHSFQFHTAGLVYIIQILKGLFLEFLSA